VFSNSSKGVQEVDRYQRADDRCNLRGGLKPDHKCPSSTPCRSLSSFNTNRWRPGRKTSTARHYQTSPEMPRSPTGGGPARSIGRGTRRRRARQPADHSGWPDRKSGAFDVLNSTPLTCLTRSNAPSVCRQSLSDSCAVFRREGSTTYNAPIRLRGVTEKPPIRTFPCDCRLKAVSKISPRLGSTPGDKSGLQGTRLKGEGNELSGS